MSAANIDTVATGTSDANGNVTIKIPQNPGVGFKMDLNISVINSPPGGVWLINRLGSQIGNFNGTTIFGPVTIRGQETLSLVGSGLQPNTVYNAHLLGTYNIDDGTDSIPNNVPTSVVPTETTTLLVNGITKLSDPVTHQSVYTITPPSNCRKLSLAFTFSAANGNEQILIQGVTTGLFYFNGSGGVAVQYADIEPLFDQQYKVILGNMSTGVSSTLWVMASQSNAAVTNTSKLTPLYIYSLGGQYSTTFTPSGIPFNFFNQLTEAANGTYSLIGSTSNGYYLNYLTLFLLGNLSAALQDTVTNQYFLIGSNNGPNPSLSLILPCFGQHILNPINLIVSNYVSGSVVTTASYG